jgi:hypothetical protein
VELRGFLQVALEFLELLQVLLGSLGFRLFFLFVIEAFQLELLLELLVDISHFFRCILNILSPLE